MKVSFYALCVVTLSVTASATTGVLQVNKHADTYIAPAINAALGVGHVDTDIFVDTTNGNFAVFSEVPGFLANTSASYASVASGATVNHAPYPIGGFSACCWTSAVDPQTYSALLSQHALFTMAYAASINVQPTGTQPPILTSSVSSSNSVNGGTGPGIEFALSAGYLGLDTSADSWDTAELAGFYISMEFQHPTWNVFDIKGAFRQTAANWATGYSEINYGYGALNYASATLVSAPSAVYLEPPMVSIQNNGFFAVITLYPFRQTRRDHEVIYSVNASYNWPVKNEYTASDIAASGATLLFTGNSTDTTPQFTYSPATSGTVTLVAFTTDGTNFSRHESFSNRSISLTVGTSCH